ncbi:hypothetical protein EVAR_67934_1 [Eumeta japonica]|uniref:Uncharacterized protein n=1 Tax=Eumeta variegata TaxID=151549 RepID=A0A4C1ZMZ4_EUMVA|nr:hypothetical protein EVAR_67934_1 [Eumeta japonica]
MLLFDIIELIRSRSKEINRGTLQGRHTIHPIRLRWHDLRSPYTLSDDGLTMELENEKFNPSMARTTSLVSMERSVVLLLRLGCGREGTR